MSNKTITFNLTKSSEDLGTLNWTENTGVYTGDDRAVSAYEAAIARAITNKVKIWYPEPGGGVIDCNPMVCFTLAPVLHHSGYDIPASLQEMLDEHEQEMLRDYEEVEARAAADRARGIDTTVYY